MSKHDRLLLQAASQGDHSAFADFVRRYTGSVLRFCSAKLGNLHESEDAVQESMLRLYRQVRKGAIPTEPVAWLFGIAHRCCQEQLRKRAKHASEPLHEDTALTDAREKDPIGVGAFVDRLDDADRALLVLRYTRGLSCREIAEHLGQPIGTVTSRLTRIYAQLRQTLTSEAGT